MSTVTRAASLMAGSFGSSAPTWEFLSEGLGAKFVSYLNTLDRLPGGQIILRYIRLLYKNDPIRSLFELALVIFAVHYFLSSKRKENKAEMVTFSDREINDMVEDWLPDPLVTPLTELDRWQLKCVPQIEGANTSRVTLTGRVGKVLNLASNDFLCFNELQAVKDAAKELILTTGVGACGPPNFYGTQDVHVRLEEDVAAYLGTELAILYGQDFVTAGSVIPAFLKRGDLCVVDSGVNLAIQKALIVLRCDIQWFEHNNMDHLETVLEDMKVVLDKQKPLRRRFIVTEGLFENSGDMACLPEIVTLKNKFKYRLLLDETRSIGVLGNTGRGLVEHYGIPRLEVAITIGSFALSFASSGGFCAGVHPMVHHQRIQSNAYVFSASLPPYSAKVASHTIRDVSSKVSDTGKSLILLSLQERIVFLHNRLSQSLAKLVFMELVSSSRSPIVHVGFSPEYRAQLGWPLAYGSTTFLSTGKPAKLSNAFDHNYNAESFMLQKIIDLVLQRAGILITRTKLILEHEDLPVRNPHLLIQVNTKVLLDELTRLVDTLVPAIKQVCATVSNESDVRDLNREIVNY